MVQALLKDCRERLNIARKEFVKQQITIKELKQKSLFKSKTYFEAPTDYRRKYFEELEIRRRATAQARKAEEELR